MEFSHYLVDRVMQAWQLLSPRASPFTNHQPPLSHTRDPMAEVLETTGMRPWK